jgi:hypothetical protein
MMSRGLHCTPKPSLRWSKYNLMDALITGALAVSSASIGFDIPDIHYSEENDSAVS